MNAALVGEVGVIAEELPAAGVVRGDQHLQHHGPEQPRQYFHRQEIFRTAPDPPADPSGFFELRKSEQKEQHEPRPPPNGIFQRGLAVAAACLRRPVRAGQ
jgi:hypothetical protein